MKKNIIIAVLALGVLAGFGYTADLVKNVSTTLISARGNEVLHPGAIGKSYVRLASTTGVQVCTGKCLLFDVILTSGPTSSYISITDSDTAEATLGYMFKAQFGGTGVSKSLADGSNAFPITCDYGIGIDLSAASTGEEAIVIYKDLD